MREIRSPLDGFRSPFGPQRGGAEPLIAGLLSLLSPAAAQLLIHPVDERFLFQDRAGTIPVTADGQVVGRILDVGPLGIHLTAASDPARGVFRRSGRYRWIEFNGVNTAYSTDALPAPGVDKAQVFAAVRRLSHDTSRVIAEMSPTGVSFHNSWSLTANVSSGSHRYVFSSRATGAVCNATSTETFSVPHSGVVTGLGDISVIRSTVRINGAQTESLSSPGSSNFNPSGNYSLFAAARNRSSLFFNGNIYGALITRFSAANLSTDTITAVEALLTAEITGAP